jgi:hypothetical protein
MNITEALEIVAWHASPGHGSNEPPGSLTEALDIIDIIIHTADFFTAYQEQTVEYELELLAEERDELEARWRPVED